MAKGKARANPFIECVLQEEEDQPTFMAWWVWQLEGLVPNGAEISFEKLSHRPGVFRPLLSALWKVCVECIPPSSHETIVHLRRRLQKFETFLSIRSASAVQELTSLSDLERETLVDYRAWINRELAPSDGSKTYRALVRLLLTLRDERSPWPGAVPQGLEIPTKALLPATYGATEASPFTKGEQAAIDAACKKAINRTIERLNEGKRLLSEGEDPRNAGALRTPEGRPLRYSTSWESTQNILWYIVNVLGGRMPGARPSTGERSELVGFLHSKSRANGRAPISKQDAFDLLFPHLIDIAPLIVLLSLKTGLNAEAVLTLERDCLQGSEGHITKVRYKKSRGSHDTLERKFSHRGANSPVGIIKLVLQLTQCLVALAEPEARKSLWLCHYLRKGQRDGSTFEFTNQADVPNVRHFTSVLNGGIDFGRRRKGFFEKNDVRDRDGEILYFNWRIARKTKATNEYLRHGNLANVSKKVLKHHGKSGLNTTALHYLTNDATHHVHDGAVRNAQDKTVADARRTVIAIEQPDATQVKELSRELQVSEQKVISIFKGEQDVFIASCKDFYNKPGGRPDTPCDDPWACFMCPNSLWTSRILPRLFKFLWFMDEQRSVLSSTDWLNKFSIPHGIITQEILPRFETRTVEWAKAEAQSTPFYVPARLREL